MRLLMYLRTINSPTMKFTLFLFTSFLSTIVFSQIEPEIQQTIKVEAEMEGFPDKALIYC